MTDQRILDAINITFVDSDGPLTLAQIYESVQAQIPDELTESGRRQIAASLALYYKKGLVREEQGMYTADFGFNLCNVPGMPDRSDQDLQATQHSVRYFIRTRRKPFTLRDVFKLKRFYDIQNGRIIVKFIESLCESGQLETVGHQTYRPTASFQAEQDGSDDVSSKSSPRRKLKEAAP